MTPLDHLTGIYSHPKGPPADAQLDGFWIIRKEVNGIPFLRRWNMAWFKWTDNIVNVGTRGFREKCDLIET